MIYPLIHRTRISGLDIHFLRASPPKGSSKTVVPLLMVHGWPGSVVEFYDVIPLLTNPQPDSDVVFDVICPSIPGYGFSEPSAKPGNPGFACRCNYLLQNITIEITIDNKKGY